MVVCYGSSSNDFSITHAQPIADVNSLAEFDSLTSTMVATVSGIVNAQPMIDDFCIEPMDASLHGCSFLV